MLCNQGMPIHVYFVTDLNWDLSMYVGVVKLVVV